MQASKGEQAEYCCHFHDGGVEVWFWFRGCEETRGRKTAPPDAPKASIKIKAQESFYTSRISAASIAHATYRLCVNSAPPPTAHIY